MIAVAAIVVAVSLASAAWQTELYVRIGHKDFTGPRQLVRDADLDPFVFFAPTGAVVRAQQVIPRDASYAIVWGDNSPGPPAELVVDVFRFWLLPRRFTPRLADAQWVIAYHHSSESLGVRYTSEIGLGPDVNAVEVAR